MACFRNYGATIKHLVGRYSKIAVIGAPTRGEFREEDQICSAWIVDGLIKAGYKEQIDRQPKFQSNGETKLLWHALKEKAQRIFDENRTRKRPVFHYQSH